MKVFSLAAALAGWLVVFPGPSLGDVVTGELRVLLVIVDAKQPVPRALRHYEGGLVTNVAWTDAATLQHFAFERPSSFANLFEEMSFGALTLSGDTVLVAFPYDASARTWSEWIRLADRKVQSQGFDVSEYDRKLYVLPHRPSDATTAGLSQGTVGWCAPKSYVELGCLFHELGHTIGFAHAAELLADGTTNGTGDKSDGLMGAGLSCQANVVNKYRVGWLAGKRLLTFDQTGSKSFALTAQSAAANTLQAIEIVNQGADPATGVVNTFVSFRDLGGFDGQLGSGLPDLHGDPVFDAVLVHQNDRLHGGDTIYREALTEGETYSENGVTVTVTDISGDQAKVTVTRAPYEPRPHRAAITPSNIDSEAQRFRSYDVSITNTNDPKKIGFDSFYEVTFTPIGPGWVMGWTSGFPKTVAPGKTRSFPLLVMSPANAAPGTYDFVVTVTERDGDSGPHRVQTRASYTVVGPAPDSAARSPGLGPILAAIGASRSASKP